MSKQSKKIIFHVSSRALKNRANISRLRKEGRVPANIYGLNKESRAIDVDYQGVKNLYSSQGDTALIYLQIDDEKEQVPVLFDTVDFVIIGEGILHVVFKRVSLNVKIQAEVSVTTSGEAKIDDAVISLIKDTVLVEALPADLPDNFDIDISILTEVGQSITLADLNFDAKKVELILGEDEVAEDVTLVNVQAVKEEVEPEEGVVEEGGEEVKEDSDSVEEKTEDDNQEDSSKE